MEQITQKHEKIDLLVNNAGVNPKDYKDKSRMEGTFYLDKLNAEAMLDTISINSISPMLVIKNFRGLLKKSENPKIVNISSWLGSVTNTEIGVHYGYCGSKNLLNILNKIASVDLRKDNIISVSINPGWVQTDMGGANAEFTAAESVSQMYKNVVEAIELNDSGKFFNYNGEIHPW